MRTLVGDFYKFGPRTGVASLEPIRGRPVCAEYEEVHARSATGETLRQRGVIYRDSSGRVRQEHTGAGKLPGTQAADTIVSISDPSALVAHVFVPRTGESQKVDLAKALRDAKEGSGTASCPVPPERVGSPGATLSREVLGPRIIEGFACHGMRLTIGQEQTEHWVADELVMLLLEETTSPDCKITYRVFNIRLGEPDASLFVPPGT